MILNSFMFSHVTLRLFFGLSKKQYITTTSHEEESTMILSQREGEKWKSINKEIRNIKVN